jgi:L-2-hydroxyglutarate oxidase
MHFTHTIIGAGIVGLATAYQLKKKLPDSKILVIEKESGVAKHQTGNNSGVIHSGIYYKPGSLKAINCRKGYKQLIDFCNEHNVKYDLCGKVIVATDESELPQLEKIYERGIENGLENLTKLNEAQLKEYEPDVDGIAGVHVPQTGIIDYADVCNKLYELLINAGVEFHFNEQVSSIEKGSTITVHSSNQSFTSEVLITCAGLFSDKLASMTENELDIRIIPFRGEYYKLKVESRKLVKNLIYPVPDPNFPFLGVHFTRMIDGEVECGPNAVFAFKREGYSKYGFDLKDTIESLSWPGFRPVMYKYWRTGLGEFYRSFSKEAFVKALQKLIPSIQSDDLIPGGAGVRAQACERNGGLLDDFYILESQNIYHVCNAPSPAATSSFAIGEYIVDKVIKSNK